MHAADPRGGPRPRRPVPGSRPPARSGLGTGPADAADPDVRGGPAASSSPRSSSPRCSSLVLTPLVRRVAIRLDNVDQPEDAPRQQGADPPRRRGGRRRSRSSSWRSAGSGSTARRHDVEVPPDAWTRPRWPACCSGGAVATILGVLDDTFQLRARWQLLGQLLLAALAVVAGITVTFVNNPFGPGNIPLVGPVLDRLLRAVGRGDDQQHQLHRRAGRALVGHRAHRRGHPGPHLAHDRRPWASRSSGSCASRWPAPCWGSCAGTSTRRRSSSGPAA